MSAARVAAEDHEVAHALRMARRVGDRDRRALRMAEEREGRVEARRVDHRLEVAHVGVEGEVGDIPVRKPAARARPSAAAGARATARAIHGFQIGLWYSYSRWVSQCGAFTSGGPLAGHGDRRCACRRSSCRSGWPGWSRQYNARMKLAMIGLGRMGANMAQRLAKGGHEVVAFDASPAARKAFVEPRARRPWTRSPRSWPRCPRRASSGS